VAHGVQPWVTAVIDTSAAERLNISENLDVSPLRGYAILCFQVPWLAPWATDLSPLRGSGTLASNCEKARR